MAPRLRARSRIASTSAEDQFRIEAVDRGTCRVVVSAVGVARGTWTILLDAGPERLLSVRLRPERFGLEEGVVSATRSQEDLEILRSPEHVYGAERTTDVSVADPSTAGGTFSWVRGIRAPGSRESATPTTMEATKCPCRATAFLRRRRPAR